MAKQSPTRRLLPVGNMDLLTDDQQAYVQCYIIASRHIPNGNKTAHNVQVLADRIWAARRRR